MSAEDNRELLGKRLEIWSRGDIEGADELFSKDYVMHGPQGDQYGVESFTAIVRDFHDRLEDLQVHYDHVVCDDDKVAYVWKITGMHRVNGEPHELRLSGAIVAHITDGQFVEEWRSSDAIGLLVKMGLIKTTQKPERMYPPEEAASL